MKKFDINIIAKTKKIKLTWNQKLQAKGIATWNQKLQAKGIATWQQSFAALTFIMNK